jgi:peptidoglycan hydrolase-like protein with peptidoglycan-binding domain
MKRIYFTTGRRLGYRSFSRIEGPDVFELKKMLHTLGYWRPELAVFPATAPSMNTPEMRALQESDRARYDKLAAEARQFNQYDEDTIAAVDKFRADNGLAYQGNPAGLVDARFIDALRAAYLKKKKS